MKKILPAIILFHLFTSAQSQITYQISYGDTTHFEARSILQNPDGSTVFLGSINIPGDSSDIILTKADSVGTTIWSVLFSTPRNDYGYDVKLTADNGYIICGATFGSPLDPDFDDALLIKTDQFGFIQWAYVYGGSGNDEAYSVTIAKDDGYFLAGHSNDDGLNNNKGFAMKVDGGGVPLWYNTASIQGGSHFNYGSGTVDSGFVAAGRTSYLSDTGDLFVAKYNNAGNLLWSKRFGAIGTQDANAVTGTTDGGCIIAGFNSDNNSVNATDMLIVKLDTSGTIEWSKTYNHFYEDRATNIIELTNGNYAVTGYSNSTDTIAPVTLFDFLKINSTGDTIGSGMYGDNINNNYSYGISATPDTGFIMAGVSGSTPGVAYIVKTDSSGKSTLCQSTFLSLTTSNLLLSDSAGCDTSSIPPFYTFTTFGQITTSTSFSIICLTLKVQEHPGSNSMIHVYPNPVRDALTIDLTGSVDPFETLIVTDVYGRAIKQKSIRKDESIVHLDTENLKAGVYEIELRGQKNQVVQKFIKAD